MLLAATLAALLLAAPAPAAPARRHSVQAPAAAAPELAATPQDWGAWNRARAKQGLLPRKPPQRTARVAPAPATLPASARARGKRGRALVLAAMAAPPAPALDAVLDRADPADLPATPLHALLAGLDRGGAPAARVEVDGAGLGATLRGLRAVVAVVARTGSLSVALESGVLAADGR
jgi:hypothetical protein